MIDGFPYEEYACAIKSESNVRKAGVEASVIAVENDVCRPDCAILRVAYLGRFDPGLFEDGSISKDGIEIGSIVAFEGEEDSRERPQEEWKFDCGIWGYG